MASYDTNDIASNGSDEDQTLTETYNTSNEEDQEEYGELSDVPEDQQLDTVGSEDETETEPETEAHQLENLGVELVEQTSLESRLQSNATRLLAQQSLETDQKRLLRTQTKLNKIKYELRKLQNKLNSPLVKISEKERLRKQILEMTNGELRETEEDIKDITERIELSLKEGSDQVGTVGSRENNDLNERQPGETEKEFLIRTGKLTAFGNTTGFYVERNHHDKPQDPDQDRELEVADMGPISHQNLRIPGFINKETAMPKTDNGKSKEIKVKGEDSGEEDYELEEEEEEDDDEEMEKSEYDYDDDDQEEETDPTLPGRKKQKLLTEEEIRNIDDGDSQFFESRLKTWCYHRSKHRDNKDNKDNATPEWFKPHPTNADAVLTPEFRIPGDIYPSLFDYQRTGIQWLYELYSLSHGGIISDEMGLGKTIQIVSFVAGLHYSGLLQKGHPVLIVCPATVLTQWVNEFHSWWGALRVMVLHSIGSGMGKKRKGRKSEEEEEEEELELENGLEDELMY
ncbi:hypothetical protein WICPIJ_008935, partial [Wickerhamomyces pijperi]